MIEKRWVVLVPALLAVGLLAGCFDGTVRSPPEAGHDRHPRGGDRRGPQGRQENRHRGDRQSQGAVAGVVTFAAVGDTAMGVTPTLPPEPATYFDPIKSELKGDVVFGNLEGTLTDVSESPKCGERSTECFAFRAPPEYANYLATAG